MIFFKVSFIIEISIWLADCACIAPTLRSANLNPTKRKSFGSHKNAKIKMFGPSSQNLVDLFDPFYAIVYRALKKIINSFATSWE